MKYNQLRLVIEGSKCNLHCAYCIAGYSSLDRANLPEQINEEKMLTAIGDHTFSSISIWGGEPFYNFAKLKRTVEFCERHFPKMPISIITNGSAFSGEKIEFIKKYNLHITLSHDAFNQHYRSADFLMDPYQFEMIKEIGNLAFVTVIHNFNCDIAAIFDYFEKVAKRLNKDFPWFFELFQLSSPSAMKFLPQGKSLVQFANSIDFLLAQFLQGHPYAYSAIYKILNGMAAVIDNDKTTSSRCGACNRLTVTTGGTVAYCQVQAETENFSYPDLTLPKMCSSCDVAKFCAGICPRITDSYRKKLCVIYKLFYTKLLGFLVKLQSPLSGERNIKGGDKLCRNHQGNKDMLDQHMESTLELEKLNHISFLNL